MPLSDYIPKLTPQQRLALGLIPSNAPPTDAAYVTERRLARLMNTLHTVGGFSRTLNELQRKGLIIRFLDISGGRSVRLTQLGRIYLEKGHP